MSNMCQESDRCRRWFDRKQFAWIRARSRKRCYVSAVMLSICNIARVAVIRLCAAYCRFQSVHFWKVVIPRSTAACRRGRFFPPIESVLCVTTCVALFWKATVNRLQNTYKMEELCQNLFCTIHTCGPSVKIAILSIFIEFFNSTNSLYNLSHSILRCFVNYPLKKNERSISVNLIQPHCLICGFLTN